MRGPRSILITVGLITVMGCLPLTDHHEVPPVRLASTVSQQATEPLAQILFSGGVAYSTVATRQADSAYRWGLEKRVEPAMCVASNGFSFGRAANGSVFVFVFSFAVDGPQAARVRRADSLKVDWLDTICGDSLPSWHGHLVDNEVRHRPSDCDLHMTASRPDVPFHIVQTTIDRASLYGPNPRIVRDYASTLIAWCADGPPDGGS